MARILLETRGSPLPRQELIDAAGQFVLQAYPDLELSQVDNIASSDFGASDLMFVDRGWSGLTVVRVDRDNPEGHGDGFLLSSLAYYFWLQESLKVSAAFLPEGRKVQLILISNRFPRGTGEVLAKLPQDFKGCLVTYDVLQLHGQDEPLIRFRFAEPPPGEPADPAAVPEASPPADASPSEEAFGPSFLDRDPVERGSVGPGPDRLPFGYEISEKELAEFRRLKSRYLI